MALSYELLDYVLCRLPVKYLLRVRCVSKEWCSLIDSTVFIKRHLKKTIECKTDGVIIFGDGKFYLTDFESLHANDNVAVVEINDPVLSDAEFVGAANGLVCLSKNKKNEFMLMNPSTRKYRKIPSIPREFARFDDAVEVSLCGFGYDHVNDDYKVVKITQIAQRHIEEFHLMVIVYSLKTSSWTRIQDVPSNTCFTPERGRFASGVLHWLAIKYRQDFSGIIVGFDLGLEQFKEVPCPPVRGKYFFLVPVGASLCILDNYTNSHMDVWLMNNHGAENLWYKAFSVEQPGVFESFKVVRPVAFSRSGKDVLFKVDRAKLMWYDLERKAVKNVRVQGIPIEFEFDSHTYSESLLQLTEGKQLQKPSEDKKGKKQQKKREDFLSKGFKLKL